uniref:F-box domain-containing protein n=1 Tax=Plectus sambesii TaxID=2011161 RepID=A0A914UNG2_9BILA
METEIANQAEIVRLRRTLADFNERIVCGRLTGDLPDNFLEQFSQLPDRPLEQVLRFLPTRQVPQMRRVSRKFNNVIRKGSKSIPKKESKGSVVFKSKHPGELTVEWIDDHRNKIVETTLADDGVALSELFRFMRIGGRMYFGEGLSAADKVLNQLSKAWLTIRPEMVIFAGDLSQTSRDSLRAFLVKVEPSVKWLNFQYANNIGNSLLSDDVIGAAGRLKGLMVMPMCLGSKLRDINIGDRTLLAMADADHISSFASFAGCSSITAAGIRAFIEKWMKAERPNPRAQTSRFRSEDHPYELTFYNCANVTPAAVEDSCGDLLKKGTMKAVPRASAVSDSGKRNGQRVSFTVHCQLDDRRLHIRYHIASYLKHIVLEPRPFYVIKDQIVFDSDDDHSMAALKAENARLQAENARLQAEIGQLGCAIADTNERIVCGKLMGALPDNFLEQFSQLPDRPLEQVLRFLPALQVAQMRRVSRRFNHLIKKCSSTMQKKESKGSVLFERHHDGQLIVKWFNNRNIFAREVLPDEKTALSELLRFIRIGDKMLFGKGLSANDKVLDQLSKAWLTVRPKVVVFSGDLSQTSRDSLRAFLVKVEPSIRRLNFQNATIITDSLLSDDLIGAAGRLECLMVLPMC